MMLKNSFYLVDQLLMVRIVKIVSWWLEPVQPQHGNRFLVHLTSTDDDGSICKWTHSLRKLCAKSWIWHLKWTIQWRNPDLFGWFGTQAYNLGAKSSLLEWASSKVYALSAGLQKCLDSHHGQATQGFASHNAKEDVSLELDPRFCLWKKRKRRSKFHLAAYWQKYVLFYWGRPKALLNAQFPRSTIIFQILQGK